MSRPDPAAAKTSRSRVAWWLFLGALALRLGYAASMPPAALQVGDQNEYAAIARNLAAGRGFSIRPGIPTSVRAPAYPLFIAGFYAAFGPSDAPVLAAQALLGAATCLLVLWLVRESLEDEKAARLAAGLLAAYPVLIVYSGRLLAETLFTFFQAASILFLARFLRRGKLKDMALSALTLGAATLTRPGGVLMPGLVLIILIALGGRRRLREYCLAWLCYAAVFAAVIAPWAMRNKALFGVAALSGRGPGFGMYVSGRMTTGMSYYEAALGYSDLAERPEYLEGTLERGRSPVIELEKRLSREGLALIRARPWTYLSIVLRRLPPFWLSSHSSVFGVDRPLSEYRAEGRWGPIAARLALLALQAAILAGSLRGLWLLRGRPRAALLLAAVPVYTTIFISFDMIPRYQVPAMPFLLALAAAALARGRAGRPYSN